MGDRCCSGCDRRHRLELAAGRRRHGDERRPDDRDGRDGQLVDGAGGVDACLCQAHLRHVVGDDGGDAAAQRGANAAALRTRAPQGQCKCRTLGTGCLVCRRLPSCLGRLQPGCHCAAMGPGVGTLAVAEDGGDQPLSRRRHSGGCRTVATDAAEGQVPGTLPHAIELPCWGTGARDMLARCAWDWSMAPSALAAAGS